MYFENIYLFLHIWMFYFVGVKHECTWKKKYFIFFICIFYFILYKMESSYFIKK